MKKFLTLKQSTFSDYGVTTQKELWDKVKGEYKGFVLDTETTFTKSEGSDNKYHCVFSTNTEDRHGDVVEQVFDLKSFKKNPVFLDSHNYSSIEKILGNIQSIKVKDGKLQGDIVFCIDNPLGLLAEKMVANGFIKATSIGFIPKEFDNNGRITKSELLEVSAVSVPANPEALFEKSIEKEELEVKEEEIVEAIEENKEIPQEKKKTLYSAIAKLKKDDTDMFIKIAQGLSIKNSHEKKRKMFATIRQGLK